MENSKDIPSTGTQKLKKILIRIGITVAVIIFLFFVAFKFTPWPSALLIRYAFNKEAVKVNNELKKHVPPGVSEILNLPYDLRDKDSKLDLYYPSNITNIDKQLPIVVWIHGGGLISGDKSQVANYCKILAAKGFAVASIDYSIAPEATYPTPLIQTNAALAYLKDNAGRLHLDSSKFFLAGDSGGSHIASQTGNIICDNHYASLIGITPSITQRQLSGLILFCGIYDIEHVNLEGGFGSFMKTVLWSYSGKKNFAEDSLLKTASILKYITANYPPCFISAGNGDPLLVQSQSLARKLSSLNVKIDTLFFPSALKPALPHEYQFNLDTEAGEKALDLSIKFIKNVTSFQ